jgi:hypothetical protein
MADPKGNEPQSYGSQAEWVTGKTGQDVNRQKNGEVPAAHADFYDSKREGETNAPHQGGHTSPLQAAESEHAPQAIASDARPVDDDSLPTKKVTVSEGGTKRDSFFKNRDYPE